MVAVAAWFTTRQQTPPQAIIPSQGVIARESELPAAPPAEFSLAQFDLQLEQTPLPMDALDATIDNSAALVPLPDFAPADTPAPATAAVPVSAPEVSRAPLADPLLTQARTALTEGNAEEGERLIQLAAEAGAPTEQLDELVARARQLRIAAHAGSMSRLSQLFNERMSQGRLVEPQGDSAKDYLGELTRAESTHPATRFAHDALATRLVSEGRAAAGRNELDAARRWRAQAEEVGADDAGVAALKQQIASAEQAAKAKEIVAATSLNKLHHVNPQYPQGARDRGTEGWVDLLITIEPDGSVGAVDVTRAEPAMVFDAAAIAAARQWQYEPVKRDGLAVSQRTNVRIRFELQ